MKFHNIQNVTFITTRNDNKALPPSVGLRVREIHTKRLPDNGQPSKPTPPKGRISLTEIRHIKERSQIENSRDFVT